jgi:4-amino-4-deoxy-L-arabinose transferase-like glycosyltransferase
LRLILWDRAVGFEQGDPLEYVNIAYKMAFDIGIEWWDLRPLLLSLIYVPVLYLAQWWPDPTGEAMVRSLRLVSVLFGVGIVGLCYLLGRRLDGEIVGVGAGLLVAVNPVVNRMSVSTFAEVPSTFFLLLGIWLLVKALDATPSSALRLALGAGLAIGAGCMIRYQAIFFLPPIGLWVAAVALARAPGGVVERLRGALDWRGWSGALVLGFGAGIGIAVVAQALIELVAYGRPFHSLLVSFEYNVTSGLAPVEFGQEPFDWFFRQVPSWLGPLTAVMVAIGLLSLVRGPSVAGWRLVALAGLTMLLALSALPHKEERFMSQVVPLLALLAAVGARTAGLVGGRAWELRATSWKPRARRLGQIVTAIVALLGCAAPMLVASLMLDLESNVGYVEGVKKAAELRPGGTLGTIPWLVARPYAGTRLTLERMDRNVWNRREEVARTIEQSDFLLFPEYWLLEDRDIDKLVDARYRSIESYEGGVVLYQSRRLDEPRRRR